MAFGPKTEVVLERRTQTITGTGSPSYVWHPVRTLRGTLNTVRGDRGPIFDRMGTEAEYEFLIDKPAGLTITEQDRIRMGTRYYTITLKDNPMQRKRYTELFLTETKREQAES